MKRQVQNAVLLGGRIFQQSLVDQYAKVEGKRLNFMRYNQDSIRAENSYTDHYNINADLKSTLLVSLVIAIKFSDGGANANCKLL